MAITRRLLRRATAVFAALMMLATAALAQTAAEERDRGVLTRLIEDNLSSVSRTVIITGFEGALSSRATVDEITISDRDGVWLRATGLVLDWRRSEVLSGRIEVEELSAQSIEILRAPVPDATAPSAEAKPFSLPELPVAINIGELSADRILLGAPLLGEEMILTAQGNVALQGGVGEARFVATRQDEPGEFNVFASYSNATEELALDVALTEPAGGLVARVLGIYQRPSVEMTLSGTGPISDYRADLALATDGTPRITGTFGFVSATGSEGEETLDLRADVSGDIGALLQPEYADFFGTDSRLALQAQRRSSGAVLLPRLVIETRSFALNGEAAVDPEGWPSRVQITGTLGAEDGAPVLLPLSGPRTEVDSGAFELGFDAATGDAWTADFELLGFSRPGVTMAELTLSGGGEIVPRAGETPGRFSAALGYAATGVGFDDPGLAEAIGAVISGRIDLARTDGGPIVLSELTLSGPGIAIEGSAEVAAQRDDLQTTAMLTLTASDLARFRTLSGLSGLGGSADLTTIAAVLPLAGSFDVIVSGDTQGLTTGIAELDPLLADDGTLTLSADRDETGTRVSGLKIENDALRLIGSAEATDTRAEGFVQLDFTDLGASLPGLDGPARLRLLGGRTPGTGTDLRADLSATGITGEITATMAPRAENRAIAGDGSLSVADLAPFGDLAGRPLGGALAADFDLRATEAFETFDLSLRGATTALDIGIDTLDRLLRPELRLSAALSRAAGNVISVPSLTLRGDTMTADAALRLAGGGLTAEIEASLTDLADLAPGLTGPATITAELAQSPEGALSAAAQIAGPGGTTGALTAERGADAAGIEIDTTADIADLTAFQTLAGRPLRGAASAAVSGMVFPDAQTFDLMVEASTEALSAGLGQLDVLTAGRGTLTGHILRTSTGAVILDEIALDYPNIDAALSAKAVGTTGAADFNATLRDVGLFTDELSGPVTATGTAALGENGAWTIDTDITGPGGITADIDGTAAGSRLDLSVTGGAPLGLANAALAPRRVQGDARFDLSVNGPPALSSLSGTVTADDARLSLPTLGRAIEELTARVTLTGGRAEVDISGGISTGGQVALTGNVALTGTRQAAITLTADDIILRDPTLYETTADARIALNGALAGGALISGEVLLGAAEVRVPSSSIGLLGALPTVRHVGAPADVAQTLSRAGLTLSGETPAQTNGGGPVFDLDLIVSAPDRIFVRGRGLDAELGGTLRLGGTTRQVIPSGQFSLIRGRLDILQQRFALDEGSATLSGNFIPYLRLIARTTAEDDTVVSIVLEGPATDPEISFSSQPDLPQDEVLARLIFGRNLSEISPLQAVQLASAAATLAGRGGSGLVGDLRDTVGLSDLDITTGDDGNLAVRAGAYIGENVYTDVTVGAERTEIELNLDLTDDLTITGGANSDGETSLGIFFERDY